MITEEIENITKYHVAQTEKLGQHRFDAFNDILKGGERLLDRDKSNLSALKGQFDDLFRHCSDFVNMDLNEINLGLQRSMKRMTIAMLILTVVTVAVPIIQYGGAAILNFFSQL
jgi:hypothetical protein